MGEGARNSGIDIIGFVPWGSHFCQFYETAEDLLDILVPYFKAGLDNNEFCMWVTAEPVGPAQAIRALKRVVPDVDRYLESRQLEVVSYSDWYVKDGAFNSDRVLAGWIGKLEDALARGYEGLRLTGNTFWLEKKDWRDFSDYERQVDNVIGQYRMLAICTYSVERCGVSEVADVISTHQMALIKRLGRWEMIESAERRRAEEERERLTLEIDSQRQLFQAVVDNAPVGIAVLHTPDFVCELVNQTFQAISPSAVMVGRPFAEPWPEVATQVLSILHRVRRSGEPHHAFNVPLRIQRVPEGPLEEAYFTFTYLPLHIRQRGSQALMVLATEITEHVLARKKLEELAAEAERQAEAAERRAAELDAANKELEAFSYTVSHDLRAPLRAIDGFSQILEEEFAANLTTKGQRYLQLVRSNTLLMAELIDDLLAFSRLSRQPLNVQRVAPGELLDPVLTDLASQRRERQVEIKIGDLPECRADKTLLRQVFANLLDNALKFTRYRDVATIEVGTCVEDGATIYYVKDNGVGFDPQYSSQLFRVFHRLHATEEFEGTGVGLATVQRIIERHGGRIWAEGEVDHGATFYFTL